MLQGCSYDRGPDQSHVNQLLMLAVGGGSMSQGTYVRASTLAQPIMEHACVSILTASIRPFHLFQWRDNVGGTDERVDWMNYSGTPLLSTSLERMNSCAWGRPIVGQASRLPWHHREASTLGIFFETPKLPEAHNEAKGRVYFGLLRPTTLIPHNVVIVGKDPGIERRAMGDPSASWYLVLGTCRIVGFSPSASPQLESAVTKGSV